MESSRKIVAPEASAGKKSIILSKQEPDNERDEMTPEHRRALTRAEARQDLISVADQVAGDAMFFRRYKYPDANRHYPEDVDAMMRFVSRYYPHAKPAPLYVDEPQSIREVARCEEKRRLMREMKLRYVVINRAYQNAEGLTVESPTLLEALEQLDELAGPPAEPVVAGKKGDDQRNGSVSKRNKRPSGSSQRSA